MYRRVSIIDTELASDGFKPSSNEGTDQGILVTDNDYGS